MTTRADRLRTASRERRARQRDDLRQAILTAAAELFAEEGYEGFSLRAVAERVGYSPASIYLHFRDRDDLLFAVVDDAFESFRVALVQAREGITDPVERITALGRAYVGWGMAHPAHYRLMFMQRADFLTGARAEESAPRIASFLVLRDAVQAALDSGAVLPTDTDLMATTLWALVHGVVSIGIAFPDMVGDLMEGITAFALGMVRRGLAVQ